MRTYPLEAERLTPHFTVLVSLRCPQETGLPTLPPRVLQGAAVSSERMSQGPPGNVVASGCPPPLRRVSEQSAQTPPAGSPLQDVVLTAQIDTNPETSLERLVPLVEFLTAWKLLPNISHWVLQTIRKGYQIQFGSRPPRFMGVLSTEVAPQQVLAMEQEIKALLKKEAIEYVPHSNRETGFYSRYFIVPKKDGGLRPILDLRVLNVSVLKLKFKNVNFETNHVTDQIRGLVCHDRSQGRILSHIHPSVSQEVPEVRFWGQSIPVSGSSIRPSIITPHFHEMRRCSPGASSPSGYSHYELHRRLVDSSSVASVGSSASRCRSCPHGKIGVTAKRQEKCAFSITEDHFPGRDMGLNVDAGAPVTGTYRVHPIGCEKNKARPVTHCQTVSETVGSYGSSIQRDTLILLLFAHSLALHTLSHCTSYSLFYFIICFLLHSHHIYIYTLSCFVS